MYKHVCKFCGKLQMLKDRKARCYCPCKTGMNKMTVLAPNLKDLRFQYGVSQSKVATALGLTISQVRFEERKQEISFELADKFIESFSKPPQEPE
ncbi:helix-turn-helix domain-containing protein [Sporomusa malonica]|uniref:Helix-turn-helix n=1 Tax=Sporomusa malonica TaxID=112901 RepID=A0A1W2A4B7_9FIRM|nr:helix-turn-helix transcriptional regulator [Sporomusa malonica]SMC55486.1 hypothetical protein SAMN04488500_1053 [Sporomusa malonica]